MQFKYPELLWGLFLLLIPIFIHLFQLRRFRKTPFTNVKFLKKVVSESRKSNSIKRWLLLLTRMALLAALIFAFAQPFFAKNNALKEKKTVIYLDDSFSMQAKTANGTLLSDAVQDLLKVLPEENTFSLFTNEAVFRDVTLKEVQNELLTLAHSSKQLDLDAVYLKANTFFDKDDGTIKNLVVISDFQQHMTPAISDSVRSFQINLVQVRHSKLENIAIDSVYFSSYGADNVEITALVSSNFALKSTPVSLFNGEQLIAKTSASFTENNKGSVVFSLQKNEVIRGKIQLADAGLSYDNDLYFNIDEKEKIKVLSIGEGQNDYLNRIFTTNEFDFVSSTLKNLDYGAIDQQNLIVVNELEALPNALITGLGSFYDNGGHLLIIPLTSINLDSYNALLSKAYATSYTPAMQMERKITTISFLHPIYKNVFSKNVTNFQYPKVSQYYGVKTKAPVILALQDKQPFLLGANKFFAFTASLSRENSNFTSSPLIVPTFYNIGVNSLKLPELYYQIENDSKVDIPLKLAKDNILRAKKDAFEFIPRQESFANKVSLSFYDNPTEHGIYTLLHAEKPIRNISFNYSRKESNLVFEDVLDIDSSSKNESIDTFFERIQKESTINELWKWFIILALFFMGIEVLIQKYLK